MCFPHEAHVFDSELATRSVAHSLHFLPAPHATRLQSVVRVNFETKTQLETDSKTGSIFGPKRSATIGWRQAEVRDDVTHRRDVVRGDGNWTFFFRDRSVRAKMGKFVQMKSTWTTDDQMSRVLGSGVTCFCSSIPGFPSVFCNQCFWCTVGGGKGSSWHTEMSKQNTLPDVWWCCCRDTVGDFYF